VKTQLQLINIIIIIIIIIIISETKETGILELNCDYVLLLLSPVENVEALFYWSSENAIHYHLVHIFS
jgi:hypothetical protein